MATRPADVRIDDLVVPSFPADAEAILSVMTTVGADLRLEPEELLGSAVEQTGLDDFGDSRFREPLAVLCAALRTEAGLSPAGVTSVWSQLVALLKNRLLVEDVLERHPEIHALRIERPIIIAGLPRTGTTHLHNLMSSDPALRSLPYWESLEPVLPESERQRRHEPDPRIARTEQALGVLNTALPHFRRMHEMTTHHVHDFRSKSECCRAA